MGIQLGSPYIPPDNVLLNTNTSTGALQFKPGTQGDTLYAGAAGVWATLAKGTSGQYLAMGASEPAWSAPPGEGWSLLTTLSPSAVTTISSGAIAAYDEYLLVVQVVGSTSDYIVLQINGDTGNNYAQTYLNGATITAQTAQPNFLLSGITTTCKTMVVAQLPGVATAAASGAIGVVVNCGIGATYTGLGGSWIGGNGTQVAAFTIKTSGAPTFTGTIQIFGRDI